MSDLLIIESPNKIKSISKFIDAKKIKIIATFGHIRDLSTWGFGFNTETYDIKWTTTNKKNLNIKNAVDKKELIKQINADADKSKSIYLATDPDREGEAISWHVYSVLNEENQKKCKRITFNEITKNAVTESFKHPRDLNQDQINSYLARRLLDRYIGFMLSSYTTKKIGGISAGRVQSIALKFLKDKDAEIKSFIPESWFNLKIELANNLFPIFKKIDDKYSPQPEIKDNIKNDTVNFAIKKELEKLVKSLNKEFLLSKIGKSKPDIQAQPQSFKTSTLYEYGINKLHISAKTVEKNAQKLYEGIDIDGETISLITYPRTDRNDLSETFLEEARQFIVNEYSEKYLNVEKKVKTKKTEEKNTLVQGAHEGIRPTDITIIPSEIKEFLPETEYKLYELIWVYTVCSLMKPAEYAITPLHFDNNGHSFQYNITQEIFDGYKILMKNYSYQSETKLVDLDSLSLEVGKTYESKTINIHEVSKKPPSPYSEATLIKSLEEKGIGRPSTYSTITNVVLNREYATKEKNHLIITELGLKVSEDLNENFSNFINYGFTKQMEKDLDDISEQKTEWKTFLDSAFEVFKKDYEKAQEKLKESTKILDRTCPFCEKDLLWKFNYKTKTKFIGCSGFPDCKFLENTESNFEKIGKNCPNCEKELVKKKNKWNRFFISCTGYPDCKYIENINLETEKLDQNCPDCKKHLIKRKNKWNKFFVSCSGYPDCKYIENAKNNNIDTLEEDCPKCTAKLVKRKNKWNRFFVSCSAYPKCKYIKKEETEINE